MAPRANMASRKRDKWQRACVSCVSSMWQHVERLASAWARGTVLKTKSYYIDLCKIMYNRLTSYRHDVYVMCVCVCCTIDHLHRWTCILTIEMFLKNYKNEKKNFISLF